MQAGQEKLFDLITKQLTQEATEAELRALEALLTDPAHQKLYDWVNQQWKASQPSISAFDTEGELAQLHARIQAAQGHADEAAPAPQSRLLWQQRWLQVAAAVAFVLLGTTGIWQLRMAGIGQQEAAQTEAADPLTQFEVGIGQAPQRFELADGSSVWLNAQSSLEVMPGFGDAKREVRLIGEAFFEVQRDTARTFVVHTRQIATQVLGTSFNVSAYPKADLRVTVATGKVQVSDGEQESELHPHEQVRIGTATPNWEKSLINKDHIASWRNGVIWLYGTKLAQVSDQFERRFGYAFEFSTAETGNCKLYGKVDIQEISTLLISLNQLYRIDYVYDRERKHIFLSGGDCAETP